MAFATLTDVEDRLGRDLESDEAFRAAALLEDATDAIRAAAGGQLIFPPVTETITIVGAGRKTLRLPQIPVTAVTAVTVTTTSVATVLTTLDYGWNEDGRFEAIGGGFRRRWNGIVTVTYTHGYAVVPLELVGLCARAAVSAIGDPAGADVKSESYGPYSVTLSDRPGGVASLLSDADSRIAEKYAAFLLP